MNDQSLHFTSEVEFLKISAHFYIERKRALLFFFFLQCEEHHLEPCFPCLVWDYYCGSVPERPKAPEF